ncbi:sigma-70 family RNA polymerase sigma factor [Thiopseudomonas alkaliphila]|uniref:sigma-70 family RNA polymerase sigma factor n=1 Tax=Thiopseudomonas alkaliphila TaxID=1697053 RepID=UPI00069F63A6|nr:sigma-70 family RNA polymerase sigma factor [Thiopseudomonas alkaliphila]
MRPEMTPHCVLSAWDRHEQELRIFLLKKIADPYEIDDLLQELFLKLITQGQSFCGVKNPRTWLFRVMRNSLTDRYRTAKTFIDFDPEIAQVIDEKPPILELEACILRNLENLSDKDRSVIEQCDLQGLRQEMYAETQGLTLSAVKSRLLRARQRLRVEIVNNCQVRFDENGHVCCHVPR